jgi:DnaJ-domain-containing protein 1
MEGDIVKRLREMERILGELQVSGLGLMDDMLREAFDPEFFLRYAASLGIDLSQSSYAEIRNQGLDPYQLLCLEKTATDDEVKTRYRSLMRVLHPDTANSEGTNKLCQMVNEAYERIKKERGLK